MCVGPLAKPTSFYVVVQEDIKYQFDNCLKALDFLFKLFFSVQARYPNHADTLWLFIQKGIYDIHLNEDNCTSSLNVILGQVRAAVNNAQAIEVQPVQNN